MRITWLLLAGSFRRHVGRLAPCAFIALLSACAPVNDPSAGLSVGDTVALIDRTPHSDVASQAVADAFAFGARSTQAQRDALQHDLVGHTVEWDLPVADVGFADGRFEVMSQAIPVTVKDVVPTLKVMAFVLPRDDRDQALLMSLKPNDIVRVRGIVQEIRSGRTVAVVPAFVVHGSSAG
jgi:hypothetical protein